MFSKTEIKLGLRKVGGLTSHFLTKIKIKRVISKYLYKPVKTLYLLFLR